MTYYPSNAKYEKERLLRVLVKFNRNTEPELVARVESQPNRAGYLKRLVKEDLQRERDAHGKKEGEGSGGRWSNGLMKRTNTRQRSRLHRATRQGEFYHEAR